MPPPRTLARYATVLAVVLVVGGLFLRQQRSAGAPGAPGGAPGVIDSAVRPAVGGPAPDFALQEAGSGRLMRLSDFRGQTVVLNFWATWCPPCREEMPLLQQTFVERQARGDLVVLAVDYEEPDALVTDFIRQFGLTFPVLMDRDGSVRLQYGVTGLPTTFFIDRDGVIRDRALGPVLGGLLPAGIAAADEGAAAAPAPRP